MPINKPQTCNNCKFWRFIRNEDYNDWKGPHGECKRIHDFSFEESAWVDGFVTYGDFNGELQEKNIKYSLRMEKDLLGNDLVVDTSLITKPNFGCNLFEDKENKQ